MGISMSSISQGAMTAAVTVGSALQSFGHGVAAVASTTAANVATSATATTANLVATVPATMPTAVAGGAVGTAQLADSMALVEKPARAVATAIPKSTWLTRTAGFLSKALPIVTIGAGALAGARIVDDKGAQALLTTKDGRGAVLSTVGGALLLVPTPVTQLAAAGVLAGVAVNQFGGLDRLDDAKVGARSAATSS
jgi:hypothetical protein